MASICLHIYTDWTESGKTHHSIVTFFFLRSWRRGFTLWRWSASFFFLSGKFNTRKDAVPLFIVFVMTVVSACCSLSHDVCRKCTVQTLAEFQRARPCVWFLWRACRTEREFQKKTKLPGRRTGPTDRIPEEKTSYLGTLKDFHMERAARQWYKIINNRGFNATVCFKCFKTFVLSPKINLKRHKGVVLITIFSGL